MRAAWLLVAAVVLAGCSGSGSEDADAADPGKSGGSKGGPDVLRGWVLDAAIAPIEGATVTIPGENATATTGADGGYAFSSLPVERALVVVAQAPEYKPLSKSITLRPDTVHEMNFTLARVPVKEPFMEKQSFNGFIGCSGVVRTEEDRENIDCSSVSPQDERVWDFTVGPDTKGIIVEIAWTPQNDLAKHLNVTLETVDFGGFDETLVQQEGETLLRAQVPTEKSDRFYRQGGTVRMTVDIGRNIEDEEAGIGVGLALQQDFEAIASIFYVAPPTPGYTAAA